MTTNEPTRITPADVEYVPVTSIEVGDILVSGFHTRRQHDNEAPTARQLATRAMFNRVDTIDNATTPRGHAIIEFNVANAATRTTCLPTINVWRVKRAGV